MKKQVKKQKKRLWLIPAMAILTLISMSLVLTAQAQTSPLDQGPTATAEPPGRSARQAAAEATFAARTPLDYRIAYLIQEEAIDSMPVLTTTALTRVADAIPVHDWDEFLTLNDEEPFDIVIFHTSMFDKVDSDWFHVAYRNNVIIIGLNTPFQQMQTLTGDMCLEGISLDSLQIEYSSFVTYFTLAVTADTEADRQAVIRAKTELCADNLYEFVDGYTNVIHGSIQEPLSGKADDLRWFVNFLRVETMNYDPPQRPEHSR